MFEAFLMDAEIEVCWDEILIPRQADSTRFIFDCGCELEVARDDDATRDWILGENACPVCGYDPYPIVYAKPPEVLEYERSYQLDLDLFNDERDRALVVIECPSGEVHVSLETGRITGSAPALREVCDHLKTNDRETILRSVLSFVQDQ